MKINNKAPLLLFGLILLLLLGAGVGVILDRTSKEYCYKENESEDAIVYDSTQIRDFVKCINEDVWVEKREENNDYFLTPMEYYYETGIREFYVSKSHDLVLDYASIKNKYFRITLYLNTKTVDLNRHEKHLLYKTALRLTTAIEQEELKEKERLKKLEAIEYEKKQNELIHLISDSIYRDCH